MQYVPVIDKDQSPLMPCHPARARQLIKTKEATPFFKKGIFCIRLNREPSSRNLQEIVVGIDPGSKKEGLTVKSKAHTFLNIQLDAVTWVKDAVETRRSLRHKRRQRKTPYRKRRSNRCRNKSYLPPSTKARWQLKTNVCKWLKRIYPITIFVIEDVKAKPKKCKKNKHWNKNFSPLQYGKNYFYKELEKLLATKTSVPGDSSKVILREGTDTSNLREQLGLLKTKKKMDSVFEAHCVDSWVLCWDIIGGSKIPENKDILCITPLRFHRRQLHVQVPIRGGIRKLYGSTRSMGFKRGSIVKHSKYSICLVGGTSKGKISLNDKSFNERLSRSAKVKDIKFLSYNNYLTKMCRGLT